LMNKKILILIISIVIISLTTTGCSQLFGWKY